MRILFTKLPGEKHAIAVHDRRVGPSLSLPIRETGPTIPHDLAHAAVEEALGLMDGFWATVDRGAQFEGFRIAAPSRHTRAGIKVLERHGEGALPAELAVSHAHRVWSGQRTSGRGLSALPLNEGDLSRAVSALDRAGRAWADLEEGASLEWHWRTR